jgi:hypothetical protein
MSPYTPHVALLGALRKAVLPRFVDAIRAPR